VHVFATLRNGMSGTLTNFHAAQVCAGAVGSQIFQSGCIASFTVRLRGRSSAVAIRRLDQLGRRFDAMAVSCGSTPTSLRAARQPTEAIMRDPEE
jgi:hypothetical protein